MRRAVIYAAAAIFAAALVHRYYSLGGPYFAFPETVSQHVAPEPFASDYAIRLVRKAEPLLPRGASVTAFQPSMQRTDLSVPLTAAGLLPRHQVLWPDLSFRPDYVLAVREPLDAPEYRLIAEFPEGKVYRRIR